MHNFRQHAQGNYEIGPTDENYDITILCMYQHINQAAQANVMDRAPNNIIASMQASRAGAAPSQINMDTMKCTYEQLQHAIILSR